MPKREETLSLIYWVATNLPFALEGDKAVPYTNILEEIVLLVRVLHRKRTKRMHILRFILRNWLRNCGTAKSKICRAGQQAGDPGKS